MFRRAMAVTMSLLLTVPLWAISSPVGTIAVGSKVTVAGTAAATGSSLYSGDTLSVEAQGKASLLLSGGSRAIISPNSEARVTRDGSALALELVRGGMAFTSSAKSLSAFSMPSPRSATRHTPCCLKRFWNTETA